MKRPRTNRLAWKWAVLLVGAGVVGSVCGWAVATARIPGWVGAVITGGVAVGVGVAGGMRPPRTAAKIWRWLGVVGPVWAWFGSPWTVPAAAVLAVSLGLAPVRVTVAWIVLFVAGVGAVATTWTWPAVAAFILLLGVARWQAFLRLQRRHNQWLQTQERRYRALLEREDDLGIRRLDPEEVKRRAVDRERELIGRLQEIVATARRAMGAHGAFLYLRNDEDRLELAVYDSVHRELELRPTLDPGEGLIGWAFRQAEPFLAMEYAKPVSGLNHYLQEVDIRSFIAVPVMGEDCEGVLALDSMEVQAFAEEEHRQIVEVMAGQVLHWLQYNREKHQTHEELEHWRAFFEVAHQLQSVSALQEAADYFLDLVEVVTHADFAAIIEPLGEGYIVASLRGGGDFRLQEGHRFDGGESWAAWALTQQGVRGVADLGRRKTDLPLIASGDQIPVEGSCLAVPFAGIEADQTGGLILWSRRTEQFGTATTDTLSRLAAPFELAYARAKAMESLERLATTDGLTGLWNRRVAMERLAAEQARSGRTQRSTSIVMLDVDHFKSVNDTHGHNIGDDVLVAVADVLQDCVRGVDMAARHGGEEFLLILPDTELEGAARLAERVRTQIARTRVPLPEGKPLSVTASFGVAAYDGRHAEDVDHWLHRADEALYLAKERGRNQVCVSRITQQAHHA